MTKEIHITFAANGEVKIDAIGFQGCGCTDATKVFEEAISGAAPKKRQLKSEYFQQSVANQNQVVKK